MATSKKDPQTINTGGGAYVGGKVTTGGDFVGRDQVKTVYEAGGSVEDLVRLMAEVRALLPRAGLDPDLAEVIEGDFRVLEDLAAKDRPRGGLIKDRLEGISKLIQETGKTSGAVENILKLLGKGAALAGGLL